MCRRYLDGLPSGCVAPRIRRDARDSCFALELGIDPSSSALDDLRLARTLGYSELDARDFQFVDSCHRPARFGRAIQ
ncbi:hypothetical protein LCGC14_2304440 [marine sediment metagenome]|uniref:Uncharacterized protein n=1 Tax=marine sediment metagenome TaxID=412755 RepID=A0A0F9EZX0_9ZZZZ